MVVRLFGEADSPISPAWAAERAILLAARQEDLILDVASDGGVPKLVIKIPPEKALDRIHSLDGNSLSDDAASIQKQIESARTRLALYLPAGYDGTPLATNFQDLQIQQSRDFAVAEISRIMGVPLSKLNIMSSSASGRTAEQDNLAFYQDTLRPVLVNLEKRMEADLLTPEDRGRFQIKANVAAILRGDIVAQTDALVRQWQVGRITTNEWRALDDLPPLADDRADRPNWPVNMATDNVQGAIQPTNPADGGISAAAPSSRAALPETQRRSLDDRLRATRAAFPAYEDAIGRITRKEKALIGRVAKAALEGRAGTQDIVAAMKKLYGPDGELRHFIEANVGKPVQQLFDSIRSAIENEVGHKLPDAELRKVVNRYISIWVRDYTHWSEYQILEIIRSGMKDTEILQEINQTLDKWVESRPQEEAKQETNRGRNVFSKALYIVAGVSMLRWVTSGGGCPLCSPYDGRTFSPQNVPSCPLHKGCECSYTTN